VHLPQHKHMHLQWHALCDVVSSGDAGVGPQVEKEGQCTCSCIRTLEAWVAGLRRKVFRKVLTIKWCDRVWVEVVGIIHMP